MELPYLLNSLLTALKWEEALSHSDTDILEWSMVVCRKGEQWKSIVDKIQGWVSCLHPLIPNKEEEEVTPDQ